MPTNKTMRCNNCSNYRQTLNRMVYRMENNLQCDPDRTDMSSHTNYRFLSSPQKVQRLKSLHAAYCEEHQKVIRLNQQVDNLMERRGVEVDEEIHDYLLEAVKSENVNQEKDMSQFAKTFWETQCKAASLNNAKSMRWHPLMIRWCLYLRHVSGRSYEILRESGVIKLPSQRTLRDYTYYTKATCGFSEDVDQQLMMVAKIDSCPEREKYVIILMDEMHVKEGLVYDKHTGKFNINVCT